MVAADFDSYLATHELLAKLYLDKKEWTKRCIHNIANMGTFSSDRSIKDYAEKIWEIKPVHVTMSAEISVENPEKAKKNKKK